MGFLVKSLSFKSRGIGQEFGFKCCSFCGSEVEKLCNNLSGFVESKDEGEAIVEAINGSVLDYRENEPNWIQVKIGSCRVCKPRLYKLHIATKENNNRISLDMFRR